MAREGVGITVDSRKVRRALQTLVKELGSKRVFTELGIATRTEIDTNFQKQGNDEGRWRSLTVATLEARRGNGRGAMILQDTGTLRNSMTFNINGKQSVDIGTNVKYGRYHQEGVRRTGIPRGFRRTRRAPSITTGGAFRIPKRPFLPSVGFAENNIAKRVIDALFAEIKRKMENAGGGTVV